MAIERKNDRGLINLERNIARVNGTNLKAGIFKESRASRSAISGSDANILAYRYQIHDEGRGRNPKRETLEPGMDRAIQNDPVVKSFLNYGLEKDRQAYTKQINRAGLRLSSSIQKEITRLKTPAKKQSTIEAARRRYGGTRQNPLIQTGEMRNAVDFRYNR